MSSFRQELQLHKQTRGVFKNIVSWHAALIADELVAIHFMWSPYYNYIRLLLIRVCEHFATKLRVIQSSGTRRHNVIYWLWLIFTDEPERAIKCTRIPIVYWYCWSSPSRIYTFYPASFFWLGGRILHKHIRGKSLNSPAPLLLGKWHHLLNTDLLSLA